MRIHHGPCFVTMPLCGLGGRARRHLGNISTELGRHELRASPPQRTRDPREIGDTRGSSRVSDACTAAPTMHMYDARQLRRCTCTMHGSSDDSATAAHPRVEVMEGTPPRRLPNLEATPPRRLSSRRASTTARRGWRDPSLEAWTPPAARGAQLALSLAVSGVLPTTGVSPGPPPLPPAAASALAALALARTLRQPTARSAATLRP